MRTFIIKNDNSLIIDKKIIASYEGKKLPKGWRYTSTTLRINPKNS